MKLSLKAGFSQIEPSAKEIQATKACVSNEKRAVELNKKISELKYEIERER